MHVIYIQSCELHTHNLTCQAQGSVLQHFQDEKILPGLCNASDLLRSHAAVLAWN